MKLEPEEIAAIADAVAARLRPASPAAGARALGLGPRQLLELVRRGEIAGYRAGRRIVARREDVVAWVAARRVERPAPTTTAAEPHDPIAAGLASGRLRVLTGGGRK